VTNTGIMFVGTNLTNQLLTLAIVQARFQMTWKNYVCCWWHDS